MKGAMRSSALKDQLKHTHKLMDALGMQGRDMGPRPTIKKRDHSRVEPARVWRLKDMPRMAKYAAMVVVVGLLAALGTFKYGIQGGGEATASQYDVKSEPNQHIDEQELLGILSKK